MNTARTTVLPVVVSLLLGGLGGCSHRHHPFVPVNAYVRAYQSQQVSQLDYSQLDQLLAPLALWPDPLLADILPATTFPREIAEAARWQHENPRLDEATLPRLPWDDSVKALLRYPQVLDMLASNAEWTQAVGTAFLEQQEDVMETIQVLRRRAIDDGTLVNSQYQQVLVEDGQVVILPRNHPAWIQPPGTFFGLNIVFSFGFSIGDWTRNDCDWHNRRISRSRWCSMGYHHRRHCRQALRHGWFLPAVLAGLPCHRTGTGEDLCRPWGRPDHKPRPTLTTQQLAEALAASRERFHRQHAPDDPDDSTEEPTPAGPVRPPGLLGQAARRPAGQTAQQSALASRKAAPPAAGDPLRIARPASYSRTPPAFDQAPSRSGRPTSPQVFTPSSSFDPPAANRSSSRDRASSGRSRSSDRPATPLREPNAHRSAAGSRSLDLSRTTSPPPAASPRPSPPPPMVSPRSSSPPSSPKTSTPDRSSDRSSSHSRSASPSRESRSRDNDSDRRGGKR